MPENVATFSINLEGNAPEVSKDLAARVDSLRTSISGATERIAGMGKMLRNLRGDTADAIAAKETLKAKISAEKDAVSGATAELVRHGAALTKTKTASTGAGEATSLFKQAISAIDEKIPSTNDLIMGLGGVLTGAAAAAIALGTALVAGLVSLAKWVITTGDARRSTQLMLEAFAGSAKNGEALGTQVDALAHKVPIARDKLAEMAAQLMRTRLGGQQIVDTMNVVGVASAAMGDSVGKALGDLITRGQRVQRFRIDPRELFGTGIRFEDVAAQLAKQLHISVEKAKDELFTGSVALSDGAKALRAVVEKRFGEVNAKKLLSLDAIGQRFRDTLASLTSKIDWDRILGPVSKLVDMFDASTVTGKVLQDIITNFGKILGDTFTGAQPGMKTFFLLAEIAALKVLIGVFKLKKAIGESVIVGHLLLVPFRQLAGLVEGIATALQKGAAFAGKIAGALGLGGPKPGAGLTPFAPGPPAVVAPGHQRGGMVMKPAPGEAFASVAPGEFIVPKGAGAGYAGGGMGKADVKVTFNIHGGGVAPEAVAKQLSEPGFLAMLTKTIEDACKTAGIPTQTTGTA